MHVLTSLDYSDLLRFLAYNKHFVILNKTQVNKLLFMCYGFYLSEKKARLFSETPKAWPYGPVFPIVYKRFASRGLVAIPDEKMSQFKKDETAFKICTKIVDKYCHTSAYDLSLWSHQQGSPWYQTVYCDDKPIVWNREISDEIINSYFGELSYE